MLFSFIVFLHVLINQQNFKKGDVEKGLGWKPIPLFDRDHAEEVASMQASVFMPKDNLIFYRFNLLEIRIR